MNIDLRRSLLAEKIRRRAEDLSFNFSKDGIHFDQTAHALIAQTILSELGAPPQLCQTLTAEQLSAATPRMQLLRDAYITATGKNRPGLPDGYPPEVPEQMVEEIE